MNCEFFTVYTGVFIIYLYILLMWFDASRLLQSPDQLPHLQVQVCLITAIFLFDFLNFLHQQNSNPTFNTKPKQETNVLTHTSNSQPGH